MNAIWDVKVDEDVLVFDDRSIKDEAIKYFTRFYSKSKEPSLLHQLEAIGNFPRYLNCEEASKIERLVTLEEVYNILKLCCADKSSVPDRWTMEFYLFFFDMLGEELMTSIEESRSKAWIPQ